MRPSLPFRIIYSSVLFLFFAGLFLSVIMSLSADSTEEASPSNPAKMTLSINGKKILPTNGTVAGVWFFADFDGEMKSRLLLLGHPDAGPDGKPNYRLCADLAPNESVVVQLPESETTDGATFQIVRTQTTADSETSDLIVSTSPAITLESEEEPVYLEFSHWTRKDADGTTHPVSLDPERRIIDFAPIPVSPDMTPRLADALIEWDWRMWDGIETPKESRTFAEAIDKRLPEGEKLLADLLENVVENDEEAARFEEFQKEWEKLRTRRDALVKESEAGKNVARSFEKLWRDLHRLRREIVLANPLFQTGPILFAKHVPTIASHQLSQASGFCARPGGGLFVLEEPGKSMTTRSLTANLPDGNYMYPAVSYDGKTILFSFCETPESPHFWADPDAMDRFYQIYQINPDGSGLKRLTDGPFEHFAPCFLPKRDGDDVGEIILCSTRRGGFHRCGTGPCPVHTLAKMKADGSDIKPISFHETHEWTPAVMNDGRIIYTRWDYVDRDAVFYQNLWSTRQDGTDVRIYYGNNTFNPCGTWEPKPVPGSHKVMAIGGPHHGVSAGSVMLLDTTLGVDGSEPVTRLTPEVLYPEAEAPLPQGPSFPNIISFDSPIEKCWDGKRNRPADRITTPSEEGLRWPVHSFKSPWPLAEKYFIASYSFDKLIGEDGANIPNQFGIYFCDAFGTRELIYRDLNISSLWAQPLAARPEPPAYLSTLPEEETDENGEIKPGRFFIQNVYESWPWSVPEKIKSLRIVQILPKTTPDIDSPPVGAAYAAPGKQVLGTVPVEEDGSAWFEVPARKPFLIQALGEDGRMVVGMRSLLYAQPGENSSCVGCHENRLSAVSNVSNTALASRRPEPAQITPAPDGSKPFSYPILVQPVLDRHCLTCHNNEKAEGGISLTGTPEGRYSQSYNALTKYVNFTYWYAPEGNHEPMTIPYAYGTPKSQLVDLLRKGHYDCQLTDEDWERLFTWIDGGNSLFYGTFNPENQAKQVKGERIDGPDLE